MCNQMRALLVAVLLAISGSQSALADETTFRDTEFKFRFVYPSAWQQKAPRGPHVGGLIAAPDGMSNWSIVVRRDADLAKLKAVKVHT